MFLFNFPLVFFFCSILSLPKCNSFFTSASFWIRTKSKWDGNRKNLLSITKTHIKGFICSCEHNIRGWSFYSFIFFARCASWLATVLLICQRLLVFICISFRYCLLPIFFPPCLYFSTVCLFIPLMYFQSERK